MNETKSNVPILRFPKFREEWGYKKGNEVFDSVSNKEHNSDLPILAITQEYGAIPRNEIDYTVSVTDESISSYKVVEIGDFIISLRSFQGGIEYSLYKGICSPAYIILRPQIEIDRLFYKHYFKTYSYIQQLNKKLEGIRDGKMISYKYFSEIDLPFPSPLEQQKIANFFSSIDKHIQLLKEKKDALENYKKGVMQQIFSQKIRFKDENGNDYPDWEEKKLGEIGVTYNGLTGKSKEDFGQGKPYIQYKQIFDDSKIILPKCGFVDIKDDENQNKVQFGDVFFTTSSETPKEVGFSSVLLDNIKESIYLNSFSFGFRANNLNELYPFFARYLFRSEEIRKMIVKLAQGSTRYNMSKTEFLKIKISFPCLPEQQKIANFFSSIDDKISTCGGNITKSEKYKKGLLQQMFV